MAHIIDGQPRQDQHEEVAHRFQFHPANEPRGDRHAKIRQIMGDAASAVIDLTIPGREQSTALSKLEEAMMWANAAIAREPEQPTPDWRDCSDCGQPRSVNMANPEETEPPLCETCKWNTAHPDDMRPAWQPESPDEPVDETPTPDVEPEPSTPDDPAQGQPEPPDDEADVMTEEQLAEFDEDAELHTEQGQV